MDPKEEVMGTLIYSQSVRNIGNNLSLQLASEMGEGRQSFRTEHVTSRIECYLQAGSVRIELNHGDNHLVSRKLLVGSGHLHPHIGIDSIFS